jgi:hypothetical protein
VVARFEGVEVNVRMKERVKCPYCEGDMVAGQAYIKGTLKDFVVAGWSSHQLWFRRDGCPDEQQFLSSWSEGEREGHQCVVCGAVLVKNRVGTAQSDSVTKERLCSNCGCAIFDDSRRCGFCGADQG